MSCSIQTVPYTFLRCVPPSHSFYRVFIWYQAKTNPKTWCVFLSIRSSAIVLQWNNLDGGQEVIEVRFIHPQTALTEFREGRLNLMPPQYYLLSTLADILQDSTNTPAQREKVETLSRGSFGKMVFNPQFHKKEEGVVVTYEGDETRGGPKGRLHRVKMRSDASGVCNALSFFFVLFRSSIDFFTLTMPLGEKKPLDRLSVKSF